MKEANIYCFRQSNRKTALHLAAAAVLCFLFAAPLPAQFAVRPVNLAYLAQRADVIIQGQVTNVGYRPLPGYPNVLTVEVTISVERTLRGFPGKTYTFRQIFMGLRSAQGKREYQVGQRLLLFLPSPSQFGLSSPIGIGQGRFHIASDPSGIARLANEYGNAGLFKDVERDAVRAGKQLTPDQRKLASVKRGPVPLEGFVSLVSSLTTLPRIR